MAELIDIGGIFYYKDKAEHWPQPLQVPLDHLARAILIAQNRSFSHEDLKIIADGERVRDTSMQTLGWDKELAEMVAIFYITQLRVKSGDITGDEAFMIVVEQIEELKQPAE